MQKYKEYLKSKGYKVIGNTAVLNGVKFRIREGTINTAMGEQKSHWVTLHWA